ncbi:phytase [Luteimonas sp. BDR2-5]|uniref:phytase n=1 Tax=Proluteimonas luteida TaxID=2878685 RepID=UPI001E2E7B39|nr:phytase [Luteimonas sp. BDR2-5]MCD9029426.1 phytase [Luteimonas sp. BDR2-5]
MTRRPFASCHPLLLAMLLPVLSACHQAPDGDVADADAAAGPAAEREVPVIAEAFVSALTPEDNIDSPAAWTAPDGAVWVIATAKSTDRLVVYDGATGETRSAFGTAGTGPGQFRRPNGIAVVDDLAVVVERDNHRVQVLRLPDFSHVLTFAADDLVKPYGLWIDRVDDGYLVYVTDSYDDGEDANGDDILPPFAALDRRVHRYALRPSGDGFAVEALGAFGDTTPEGALRVVESIWGDPANDRLLIAEEDESYANELKVYTLSGEYAGRTIGRDVIQAQAEGIMLKTCADGSGWWITTEQGKGRTVFHLFDRVSLDHVGAVAGGKVANTDGIWLHDAPSKTFPDGALYAVHDDQGIVAFDWRTLADALALPACTRS